MWFKNLTLFRCTAKFNLSPEDLAEKLETMRFHACANNAESSFGWTEPLVLDSNTDALLHITNGFIMLCGKTEEKVLPAAVVNELLQERILELETKQGNKVSKTERNTIKDELIFELLPKAFSFSRKNFLYIDPKAGWIIVDSASSKKAEALLSNLRRCLGTLAIEPIKTQHNPVTIMSQWLATQAYPNDIEIEEECELRATDEKASIVRCKNHDLTAPEITQHLEAGKQVVKLAFSWEDKLSLVLDENLSIKRLKFLDLIQDQVAEIETHDYAEQFDVDFAIMSTAIANFLPRLLELFGGEPQKI